VTANELDELHWSAYRYAAGEMSDDEGAAFEARLADDQTVREALEQAVELRSAVKRVLSEPAVERRPALLPRVAVWAASLAACVVLAPAALRFFAERLDRPDGKQAGPTANRSPVVAEVDSIPLAWAAVRDRADVETVGAETPDWGAEPTPTDWSLAVDGPVGEGAAGEIPRWLLAAVAADNYRRKENP
jgi:hypothetical protein